MWPLSNEGCNESACLIFAARLKTSRGNYAPNSGQTSNSMRRNSNGAPEVCSGEIFRRTLDVPVLTLSRALSGSGPKRDPGLRSKFHDVLQLTRLLTVFNVYDTEADAIRSFGTGPLAATA